MVRKKKYKKGIKKVLKSWERGMAQKLRTGLGPKVENGAQPKNIKGIKMYQEKVLQSF